MEKIVLTIGGVLKLITLSDIFFFLAILFLILFLVYVVFLLRVDENTNNMPGGKDKGFTKPVKKEEKSESKTSDELIDIVDNLQRNYTPEPIDLTKYEEEQENSAIISYQELLAKSKNNINYDDNYESGFSDLNVQKVTEESNTKEYVNLPKAVMLKYESEETFLKTLKTLQKNLVR